MALAAALFACAQNSPEHFYQDADLPNDQVATLSLFTFAGFAGFFRGFAAVTVETIDGKYTNLHSDMDLMKKLLPGHHEIGVRYQYGTVAGEAYFSSFDFMAEAGHHYEVRAGSDSGTLRVWAEDSATKAVVGMTTIVLE